MDNCPRAHFRNFHRLYRDLRLSSSAGGGRRRRGVRLLLFGGIRHAAESGTGDTSDAAHLARDTLIPRKAWKAAFVVVGVVCLWNAALLLAP